MGDPQSLTFKIDREIDGTRARLFLNASTEVSAGGQNCLKTEDRALVAILAVRQGARSGVDSGRASTLQGPLGGSRLRTTLCGSEKKKNDIHKRIRAGSTIVVEVVHSAVRMDHYP